MLLSTLLIKIYYLYATSLACFFSNIVILNQLWVITDIQLIILAIAITITFFNILKKRRNKIRKDTFTNYANLLIEDAILSDDIKGLCTAITLKKYNAVFNDEAKKSLFLDELLFAKNNISGEASDNLIFLYNFLQLHQYSLSKLGDNKWYINAKGIQELTIMNAYEYTDKISHFVNNTHEEVRIEALIALLHLKGNEGLDFLNHIKYPLSDWQQIKLLRELTLINITEFDEITNWLSSTNDSVIIFSMRIVRRYRLFHMHEQIKNCINHHNPKVRLAAIITLKDIYNENTLNYLKEIYTKENLTNQLTIINTIKEIGTVADIPFLLKNLYSPNKILILDILTAIAQIDSEKFKQILSYIDVFPYRTMLLQVKQEFNI
jgi:hypothetical protein